MQPRGEEPFTVYVIDDGGVDITVAPEVVFKLAAGLHVYVTPPLADKLTDAVEQIVADADAIVGLTVTVTTICVVSKQLL